MDRKKLAALYELPLDTWSDVDLIAVLIDRYSEPTIPPCSVCGRALSIGRCGGGEPTVWACSQFEPGDDASLKRRADYPMKDDGTPDHEAFGIHYARSEFIDRKQGGDAAVIEAVKRLRAAIT